MATQVGSLIVELEARVDRLEAGLRRGSSRLERFRSRARRTFRGLTRIVGRFGAKLAGLGTLAAAALGTFSAVQFIRGTIDAASAVDGFTIRLRNLIGAQDEAEASLGRLQEKATKVAPSLRDIIEGAATLGTVALGSSKDIEQLTNQALNISAVTGLTLEQSAQNLQRALSSGLGAADLFRERGVRALLESITGIPNLVDAELGKVRRAFEEVFGDEGVFGSAAEQFAVTLPGKISITQDALFKLQAAFGEAISPSVIAALAEVVVPAFGKLTEAVEENEEAIQQLADRGIRFLLNGFASLIEFASRVPAIFIQIKAAINSVLQSVLFFIRILADLPTSVLSLEGLEALGGPDVRGGLTRFAESLEEQQKQNAEALRDAQGAVNTGKNIADALRNLTANLGEESTREAREQMEAAEAQLEEARRQLLARNVPIDPKTARAQEAAFARIQELIDNSARAAAEGASRFRARIQELQEERREIQEAIEKARGVRETQVGARQRVQALIGETEDPQQVEDLRARLDQINKIIERQDQLLREKLQPINERRLEVEKQIAEQKRLQERAERRASGLSISLASTLQTLRAQGQEGVIAAREIERGLRRASEEGIPLEEQVKVLRDALKDANQELQDLKKNAEEQIVEPGTIGAALSTTISGALIDAAEGSAVEFADILSSAAGALLEDTISNAMDFLGSQVNELLKRANLGADLGGALAGALGIGASLLSGFLRDTETTASGQAESAVDQTEKVRGIVAGPTNIAIAQVAPAIRDAFVETNGILREQNDILRGILQKVGIGESGATVEELLDAVSSELLGDTSPSLA